MCGCEWSGQLWNSCRQNIAKQSVIEGIRFRPEKRHIPSIPPPSSPPRRSCFVFVLCWCCTRTHRCQTTLIVSVHCSPNGSPPSTRALRPRGLRALQRTDTTSSWICGALNGQRKGHRERLTYLHEQGPDGLRELPEVRLELLVVLVRVQTDVLHDSSL